MKDGSCDFDSAMNSACQSGIPVAEYVRGLVHDHILKRGVAFREKGAALRALINAGKARVIGLTFDLTRE